MDLCNATAPQQLATTPDVNKRDSQSDGDGSGQQQRSETHYRTTQGRRTTANKNNTNHIIGHGFYSISENLGFGPDRSRDCEDNETGETIINGVVESDSQHVRSERNDNNSGDNSIDDDEIEIDDAHFFIERCENNNLSSDKKSQISKFQDTAPNPSNSVQSGFLTPTERFPSSVKSSPRFSKTTTRSAPPAVVGVSTLNLNLNLPKLTETVTHGFGVKMVATASCQQLIYRSVPARPLSYTFTDVLEPKGSNQRSKTAPVSVNSPEDYAQRFKSRPTTRPRVIEFDGSTVSTKSKQLAMISSCGFPTSRAKIYIGHPKTTSPTQSQTSRSHGSKIQLAPLDHSGRRSTPGFAPGSSRTTRTVDKTHTASSQHGNQTAVTRTTTKSAGSSVPDQGAKSTISAKPSLTARETIQSAEFTMSVPRAPTPDPEDHIHNPDLLLTSSSDCDDLSILPRPKKVLPKRELPWVFRYKVKKGMNTLSRIMASKPAPNVLHSSYTFT